MGFPIGSEHSRTEQADSWILLHVGEHTSDASVHNPDIRINQTDVLAGSLADSNVIGPGKAQVVSTPDQHDFRIGILHQVRGAIPGSVIHNDDLCFWGLSEGYQRI
jgi:hypothetical protein